MFAYCGNSPAIFIDKTGAQAVAITVDGGGGGTCSSNFYDELIKMFTEINEMSNPAQLFKICYQNTFQEDYVAPCGSKIDISFHVIEEYTKADQNRDSGILSAAFGVLGYFLTKGLAGTTLISFASGVISNQILEAPHPSEIIITVIEWDWYNNPFGRSGYNRYGARYDYQLNDNMTLTLIGRWHIEPNPYYSSNAGWNANGDHWG